MSNQTDLKQPETRPTAAPLEPLVRQSSSDLFGIGLPESVPTQPIVELYASWIKQCQRHIREIETITTDQPCYLGGSADLERKGMWSRVYSLQARALELATAAGLPKPNWQSPPSVDPIPSPSSCEGSALSTSSEFNRH